MAKVREVINQFNESIPFYESLFTGYNKRYISFISAHYDIGLNTTGVLRYFDIIRYLSEYLDVIAYRENRLTAGSAIEKYHIRIIAFGQETRVQLFINFLMNVVKAVEEDALVESNQSGENVTHVRTRLASNILQTILKARDRKALVKFKAYDQRMYLRDLKYTAEELGIHKGKQRLKAGYGRA